MPKVEFRGQVIECEPGERLRDVLLRAGLSPHNGKARFVNCRGLGSCGTCAVEVEGQIGERTFMERWRLDFPPHDSTSGLRLACQIEVHEDLIVRKYPGFWGQRTDQAPQEVEPTEPEEIA